MTNYLDDLPPFDRPPRPFVVLWQPGITDDTREPFFMLDMFPIEETEDGYVTVWGGLDLGEGMSLASHGACAGMTLVNLVPRQ